MRPPAASGADVVPGGNVEKGDINAMLEKYIPKRFATAMIKHVIAVSLFFPYFYSHNDNPAYQDFILANFFVVLAMVFICTSWKLDWKRNAIFAGGLGILLIAYNVCATYMNVKYHHWYGEQINTTIAFLFFIVLLLVKDPHALIDTATIKATIHMIVASNVLAICFHVFTRYNQLRFMNDWVQLTTYPENINEQFAWVYGHKSEYGLMLVLCVAFFVVYRKQFRNIFTYVLSLGVLFVALYLSDSFTAMGAALLIFVGQFLDYLCKANWWKKLIAAVIIPLPLFFVFKELLIKIEKNRSILTLGFRTYIWSTFIEQIKLNPNGITNIFGNNQILIKITDTWYTQTTNAHNVFLNHMFRFSIPVGGLFVTLFVFIVLLSTKRNLSFKTICIWVALFVLLTMDTSLTAIELPFLLLTIFIMFFLSPIKKYIK